MAALRSRMTQLIAWCPRQRRRSPELNFMETIAMTLSSYNRLGVMNINGIYGIYFYAFARVQQHLKIISTNVGAHTKVSRDETIMTVSMR